MIQLSGRKEHLFISRTRDYHRDPRLEMHKDDNKICYDFAVNCHLWTDTHKCIIIDHTNQSKSKSTKDLRDRVLK